MHKHRSRYLITVFSLSAGLFLTSCSPATTPTSVVALQATSTPPPTSTLDPNKPLPTDVPYSLVEVETLAGFDVKEPTYLPAGVLFDHATYETGPAPRVVLHFKLVHETLGDRGAFFRIVQSPQTDTAQSITCEACETIPLGDLLIHYRQTPPTESLYWEQAGFAFQLLRTAGEPDKFYKDELLKVVGSLK